MSYFSTPGIFDGLDAWAGTPPGPMQAGPVSYLQAQSGSALSCKALSMQRKSPRRRPVGAQRLREKYFSPGTPLCRCQLGLAAWISAACIFSQFPAINVSYNAAVVINCNWPLIIKGTGNVKLAMMLDSNSDTGDNVRHLQRCHGR